MSPEALCIGKKRAEKAPLCLLALQFKVKVVWFCSVSDLVSFWTSGR